MCHRGLSLPCEEHISTELPHDRSDLEAIHIRKYCQVVTIGSMSRDPGLNSFKKFHMSHLVFCRADLSVFNHDAEELIHAGKEEDGKETSGHEKSIKKSRILTSLRIPAAAEFCED